jgi:hypothetical protein
MTVFPRRELKEPSRPKVPAGESNSSGWGVSRLRVFRQPQGYRYKIFSGRSGWGDVFEFLFAMFRFILLAAFVRDQRSY